MSEWVEWPFRLLTVVGVGYAGYAIGVDRAWQRYGKKLTELRNEMTQSSDERQAELDEFIVEMREKLQEIAVAASHG